MSTRSTFGITKKFVSIGPFPSDVDTNQVQLSVTENQSTWSLVCEIVCVRFL